MVSVSGSARPSSRSYEGGNAKGEAGRPASPFVGYTVCQGIGTSLSVNGMSTPTTIAPVKLIFAGSP